MAEPHRPPGAAVLAARHRTQWYGAAGAARAGRFPGANQSVDVTVPRLVRRQQLEALREHLPHHEAHVVEARVAAGEAVTSYSVGPVSAGSVPCAFGVRPARAR
jgi:hypothetical protein